MSKEHVYKYRKYDIAIDDYVYSTRYATMTQINRIGSLGRTARDRQCRPPGPSDEEAELGGHGLGNLRALVQERLVPQGVGTIRTP